MILLVGLGNPGKEGTRHNIGFDVIDAIAKEYSFDYLSGKIFKNKYDGDLYCGELSINQIFSLIHRDLIGGKEAKKDLHKNFQRGLSFQKVSRVGSKGNSKNKISQGRILQRSITEGSVSQSKKIRGEDLVNNVFSSLARVEFMNSLMTENFMKSYMNEAAMNGSMISDFMNKNDFENNSGSVVSVPVYLLKPTTYMNSSGTSVNKFLRDHRIGTHTTENGDFFNIVVFHDEMDRKLSKYRVMSRKSSHNGLKSVDTHIGLNYYKFGLGIERPASIEQVSNYVLSRFLPDEREVVNKLIEKIVVNLPSLLSVFL